MTKFSWFFYVCRQVSYYAPFKAQTHLIYCQDSVSSEQMSFGRNKLVHLRPLISIAHFFLFSLKSVNIFSVFSVIYKTEPKILFMLEEQLCLTLKHWLFSV